MRLTVGTACFNSCSRFAATSQVKPATPVTFPPGCEILVTNAVGSTEVITIGICLVASIAARVALVAQGMITSAFIRTSSAASPGSLSGCASADRISSGKLRPSSQPSSRNFSRNAANAGSGSPYSRTPTIGIGFCCARSAVGHPPIAPASKVRKSRRLITRPPLPWGGNYGSTEPLSKGWTNGDFHRSTHSLFLLDDLVGAQQHRMRDRQSERLCGLQVDDQ